MNSSNIDGQNTEENLTITSIANELNEKGGNKDDACEGQFPSFKIQRSTACLNPKFSNQIIF
jgi:hypothetical protein